MKKSQSSIIYLVLLVLAICAVYVVATKHAPTVSPTSSPRTGREEVKSNSDEVTLDNGWVKFTNNNDSLWRKYSINRPRNWNLSIHAYTDYSAYAKTQKFNTGNTVTIQKNGNKIIIDQFVGGVGGGACKNNVVKINEKFERDNVGNADGYIRYRVCEDFYGAPTSFGGITYYLTSNDLAALKEMDSIIKTITRVD